MHETPITLSIPVLSNDTYDYSVRKKRDGSGIERLCLKVLPKSLFDALDLLNDKRKKVLRAYKHGIIKRPATYREKNLLKTETETKS